MKPLFLLVAIATLLRGADTTFPLETHSLIPYTRTYLENGLIGLSSSQLSTAPAECFMAGVYDHATGDVPRLAVLPVWNEVDVYNGRSWLNQVTVNDWSIRSYHQVLNMYDGTLSTTYDWLDGGRAASVRTEVFASRADAGLGVVELELTPHFSGEVKVRLPVRAWPEPRRYPLEKVEKLEGEASRDQWAIWYPGHMVVQYREVRLHPHGGFLAMLSRGEGAAVAVAEAIALEWPVDLEQERETTQRNNEASVEVSFTAREGHRYVFHKYAALEPSFKSANPLDTAKVRAQQSRARGYQALLRDHANAWHQLWETDIITPGDQELQTAIHSTIFYLLGSASKDSDVSIPPMGLNTAGYYGHMFWDGDTFMFPALMVLHPEMAKPLVMFRYRTLERARLNARRNDYQGETRFRYDLATGEIQASFGCRPGVARSPYSKNSGRACKSAPMTATAVRMFM